MNVTNKPHFSKALLTGASSGIGWELAHIIAKKQITLIATGRNEQALEELQQKLGYEWVSAIRADLNQETDVKKIIELLHKEKPNLVINNAGIGFYGDFHKSQWKEQYLMMNVNIVALVHLTLEAAKILLEAKKKGTIVNISSIAAKFPAPGMAVYAATKAFVTNFSKAVDTELSPLGIRVLVSAPGQVETLFAERAAKRNLIQKKGPSITAEKAARYIWNQIEQQKGFCLFDIRNRFLCALSSIFPEKYIQKIIYKSLQKRM